MHGILIKDMSDKSVQCFAREIAKMRFKIMDFIMHRVGRVEVCATVYILLVLCVPSSLTHPHSNAVIILQHGLRPGVLDLSSS